jgi:hypothetical protein
MDLDDANCRFRFLIRDHDTTFTAAFDAVFTASTSPSSGQPMRVPRATAIGGRFVGTIRREVLEPDTDTKGNLMSPRSASKRRQALLVRLPLVVAQESCSVRC